MSKDNRPSMFCAISGVVPARRRSVDTRFAVEADGLTCIILFQRSCQLKAAMLLNW